MRIASSMHSPSTLASGRCERLTARMFLNSGLPAIRQRPLLSNVGRLPVPVPLPDNTTASDFDERAFEIEESLALEELKKWKDLSARRMRTVNLCMGIIGATNLNFCMADILKKSSSKTVIDFGERFCLIRDDLPYILLNFVGKGGFSEVWEVLNKDTWKIEAARFTKVPVDAETAEWMLNCISHDIRLQIKIVHPYILETKKCFSISSAFVSIHELCTGDLSNLIKNGYKLDPATIRLLCIHILEALKYTHEVLKIIHFDVKPHNILISIKSKNNLIFKLSDYGLHRQMNKGGGVELDMSVPENVSGTPLYQPPAMRQAVKEKSVFFAGPQVDLWGFAATVIELCGSSRRRLEDPMAIENRAIRSFVQDLMSPKATAKQLLENHYFLLQK